MICCSCGVLITYCFWSANPATQFGTKMAADVGSDPTWSREGRWGKFQFQSVQPPNFWTIEHKNIKWIILGETVLKRGLLLCLFTKSLTYIYSIHTLHSRIIVLQNMMRPVLFYHQTILRGWDGFFFTKSLCPLQKCHEVKWQT